MSTRQTRPPASAAAKPARIAALKIGVGRVCMWQGGSLWIGREVGSAQPHMHHGIQISLSLDGPGGRLLLCSGVNGEWSEFRAAMVKPNRRHEFDGRGGSIAQIFVEPETVQGRSLLRRYAVDDITTLPLETIEPALKRLGALFAEGGDDHALVAISQGIVDTLAGAVSVQPTTNPRIVSAIDFISRRMTSALTLQDVAAAVHLSPSRLRHLFVQETGTTYRGYVLWLRINRAVVEMMDGRSWTEAAHETGFADSAHLSRTFRRMFGISPAMLIREKR